jgi:hypothetical protein
MQNTFISAAFYCILADVTRRTFSLSAPELLVGPTLMAELSGNNESPTRMPEGMLVAMQAM